VKLAMPLLLVLAVWLSIVTEVLGTGALSLLTTFIETNLAIDGADVEPLLLETVGAVTVVWGVGVGAGVGVLVEEDEDFVFEVEEPLLPEVEEFELPLELEEPLLVGAIAIVLEAPVVTSFQILASFDCSVIFEA
jgi:hypothetical protein